MIKGLMQLTFIGVLVYLVVKKVNSTRLCKKLGISNKTLKMMDKSIENMKKGKVSDPMNLIIYYQRWRIDMLKKLIPLFTR